MAWTLNAHEFEMREVDGFPLLHADAEGRVIAHDYDTPELRQVLVPFALRAVHQREVGLVGEFQNVAGHSIYVGLSLVVNEGIGARLVEASGGGRGPVAEANGSIGARTIQS
jgi:hypothetical protein